jgi:predicted methyltransferase
LGFIGIRPGIVALDLSAAGGYTTELLARAIGPRVWFMVKASRAIPVGCRFRDRQRPFMDLQAIG